MVRFWWFYLGCVLLIRCRKNIMWSVYWRVKISFIWNFLWIYLVDINLEDKKVFNLYWWVGRKLILLCGLGYWIINVGWIKIGDNRGYVKFWW